MELSRVVEDLSIPFWEPFLHRYFSAASSSTSDVLSRQRIREAASLVSFDAGEAEGVEELRAYASAHPALRAFIGNLSTRCTKQQSRLFARLSAARTDGCEDTLQPPSRTRGCR